MLLVYTFESTPELRGLKVEVENDGDNLRFAVSGPRSDSLGPLIKLYFDWFNRIGPITTHEGRNVYSLYLPPIPSPADARLLEGVFRDKLLNLPTPRALTLAVTRACQCRCMHCSAEDYAVSHDVLSLDEIERVIDESVALGLCNVTFTGGEPLLRDDLAALISCVPPAKAVARVFTNAAILHAERAVSLKAAGLHAITVSLDSAEPSEHDRLRRREGSFKEVERGVANALDAGLLVGLSTYATTESVREGRLRGITSLAAAWGVHEVSVFDVIPTGRLLSCNEVIMSEDSRQKLLEEAASLNRQHRGRLRVITQSWTNAAAGFAAYFGCLAGTYQFHITPQGDFTPCDFTPISFGNVRLESTESLWKKLSTHPAYCQHQRECRMQSPTFRRKYIDPIPDRAELPFPIEKLES